MEFNITSILVFVTFFLISRNIWKRRHIYYWAWKLPGPLTLPFVGSITLTALAKDFLKTFIQICESQKSIFKMCIGNDLYVVNSEPEDVEILLSNYFNKPPFYQIWNEFFNNRNTILTAPADIWKCRRKEYNRCFNPKVLDTFHDTFLKYSKKIVDVLNDNCGKVQTDLLRDIWKCNLDAVVETLGDADPLLFEERYEVVEMLMRGEQIVIERFKKFWLLFDFIWRFSQLRKETAVIALDGLKLGRKAVALKKEQLYGNGSILKDKLRMKRLFNYLVEKKLLSDEDLQAEYRVMSIAASETTTIVTTNVILILGVLQDVQKRVYQEITTISPSSDNDLSLEDINGLYYLDRVIKETLRIFPVGPLIMRSVDENVQLKSYTQPAGSHVIIPIIQIHRNPELWPDPLKFVPDRFLPQEVKKRHRCAYIPFSYGPRNCIGIKYGMVSMKVMIAYIVRHFTIKTLDCESIQDIKMDFTLMLQPKEYRVVFERRV